MTRVHNLLTLLFVINALLLAGCSGDDGGDKGSGKVDYPVAVSGKIDVFNPSSGEMMPGEGIVTLETLSSQGSVLETDIAQADADGRWAFPERMLEPLEIYRLSVSVPDYLHLAPESVGYFYGEGFGDEELADVSNNDIAIELRPSEGIAYLKRVGTVGDDNTEFPDADPTDVIFEVTARWPGHDEFIASLEGIDCDYAYLDFYFWNPDEEEIAGRFKEVTDPMPCDEVSSVSLRIAVPAAAEDGALAQGAFWDAFILVIDTDGSEYHAYSWPHEDFYLDTAYFGF